ncbi:hypothetical protein OS493_021893 [Desmophyllum pertusum]|uniref:Fibronectin type-III domain-containing protein n=1 Tax=Desmophyllum pertusum TaxID=174260 RepID=A0A9W9ZEA6_9CNID|nr:hypothetical protein OS493_021893 [Desmophyllum pertusum]
MPTCHSGYSLAFWLQITPTATAPQIFLGTSRNNVTDLQGVFVYQTETIRAERRVIVEFLFDGLSWKVPLIIQQEIWDFVVLTWSITNHRLAAYMNGEMVNSTSVGSAGSDVSKHVKLRGSFPGQVERASLYLESGALYDHVITWNRSLTDYEVKRAFQSQMNELSKITCKATDTTLNVTWQDIKRNVFNKGRQWYKVAFWRNKKRIREDHLDYSTNHYFLKDLESYASYKVRLWIEDSEVRKRVGALVCHTKEGAPPAQINGILKGYNIMLSTKGNDRYGLITVKDAEEYLVTNLKADTEYSIAVQGFTSAGIRSRRLLQSMMGKTNKVPSVTEMPKNVMAYALDWDAIQVTWTSLDRKEEVTSYEVECCSLIACTLRVVNDSESVVVKDLPQYTLFTIKVRGRNSQNAGPWKIIREVKTLGQSYYISI